MSVNDNDELWMSKILNEENEVNNNSNDKLKLNEEEKLALFTLFGLNEFVKENVDIAQEEFLDLFNKRTELSNEEEYKKMGKDIVYRIISPLFNIENNNKISQKYKIDLDLVNELYDKYLQNKERESIIKEVNQKEDISKQENNEKQENKNVFDNSDLFDMLNKYKEEVINNSVKNTKEVILSFDKELNDYKIVSKEAKLKININYEDILYQIIEDRVFINNIKIEEYLDNVDDDKIKIIKNIKENKEMIKVLIKKEIKNALQKKIDELK